MDAETKKYVVDHVTKMMGLLSYAEEIFHNCNVEYGCCCCGMDMETHDNGMESGHSPVDQGAYMVDGWRKEYKELLESMITEADRLTKNV